MEKIALLWSDKVGNVFDGLPPMYIHNGDAHVELWSWMLLCTYTYIYML